MAQNNLKIRIDTEFPGEAKFKSAEASAKAMARELEKLEKAARDMAAAEAAAYREAEQAAAAHEAAVRKMAAAEMAAYREAARAAEEASAKQRAAMEALGPIALGAGGAIAAGVALAVKAYADFDSAMATVASSTHESAENMASLREAAMAAGKDTQYSATEAAGAIDELAKAGVTTSDILAGGLSGALSLAAAGGLDVAEAAETAATAMVQFKLGGDQVGHVADLLAAGAGKAQGSVSDLGAGLKQGGLVASQFGLSIEDTVGTLSAFASAGLIGSDAGTSFKTMLLALANPSKAAANTMKELGINAYDAQGEFVGVTDLAGQLQTSLGGLSQAQRDSALATIFGSDAIRAANVLYTQGSTGIAEWIDQTNDAGYAAVTAATKMDTLKGDIELLKGSFETAMIASGSAGDDFLREQVQAITAVVDAYNELPEPLQRATLGVGASGAAAALAAGAFLTFGPRVLDLTKNMRELDASGSKVPGTLKGIAKGAAALVVLTAAGAALSTYTQSSMDAVLSSSQATALLAKSSTDVAAIDATVRALSTGKSNGFSSLADGLKNLADPSLLDRLNDTSATLLSFTGLYSAAGRPERAAFVEQLGAMGEGLANLAGNGAGEQAAQQFAAISEQAAAAGLSQEQLLDLMPAYRDALADQTTQQTLAATSGEQLASAVTGVLPPTEDAAAAIDKMSDGLENMLSQFFSVDQASDAFASSLNDIADAAKNNGRSVEGNTDKAIANRAAMRDSADAAATLLTAMAKQGATSEELAAKAAQLKDEFVKQAAAAGFTGAEVDKVVAAYDAMPSIVQTKVIAEGLAMVASATANFKKQLDEIDGRTIRTTFQTSGGNLVGQRAGTVTARAAGGEVRGPGTETSDSIPVMLSNNEHVLSAAEVRGLGGHDAVRALRAGALGRAVGLATGGTPGAPGLGDAGAVVSRSLILGALAAAPGAVDGSRREAALRREASAAQVAEAAERNLNRVRELGATALDDLAERQDNAVQALKDANTVAEDAAQDNIERLRKSKAGDAAITAAQDRLTALKRANDVAEKALKKAQDAETDAAKTSQKKAEAAATEQLTRAKDKERDATEELKDAETELSQARDRAIQLAQRVADSITRNATLAKAFGDTSVRDARTATKALDEATNAADAASGTVRGESRKAALERRSKALADLTTAGIAWAQAQRAMGADSATVEAGLDRIRDKVSALGAAYGLSGEQIADMTDSLADQATTGADLLANLQRQLQRSEETAQAVRDLMSQGLDRGLVDQVIDGGSDNGLAMARAILGGGPGLIAQLNATQAGITATGASIGAAVSADRYAPAQPVHLAPGTQVALAANTAVGLLQNTAVGLVEGSSVGIDTPVLADMAQRITAALSTRPLIVQLDGSVIFASMQAQAAQAAIAKAP